MAQMITCTSHVSSLGMCGVWGQCLLHTNPIPCVMFSPVSQTGGVFIFVVVGAMYSAFIGPLHYMYVVT